MSLRIALLGMLAAHGPGTGYDLAKGFDSSINMVWQAKHSQIYPELAKMVESGAVTMEDAGDGRGRKVYTVTETGRAEIAEWLAAGTHRSVRNETALRAFLIPLLPADEAVAVMRAEAERQASRLVELEKLKEFLRSPGGDQPEFGVYALDMGIRMAKMLQEWASDTADALEKHA